MSKIPLLPDEYYHLYNCGVNCGLVFFTQANYRFFLQRVKRYLTPAQGSVIAYCLIPNHYHFLVQIKSPEFSQKVMQPLGTSYTKAINKQEHRLGALFQGSFQAKHITDDTYLLHLSKYIHLNPVEAGLVQNPEQWEYSSYREYAGLRNGTLPHTEFILSQFTVASDRRKSGEKGSTDYQQARRAYVDFVSEDRGYGNMLPDSLLFD